MSISSSRIGLKSSLSIFGALALSALALVADPAFGAGELDTSFGRNGVATLAWHGGSTRATAVLRQSTGKLVVAVQAEDFISGAISLVRLNADGAIDTTFGDSGVSRVLARSDYAHSYAVMPNDDIIIGNQMQGPADASQQMGLVRLHRDSGQLVPTFGQNGFAQLPSAIPLTRNASGGLGSSECISHRITISDAGFIYLTVGCFSTVPAKTGLWVAKLDGTTGAPVSAFGTAGVKRFTYESSAILPDGIQVVPSKALITPDNALAVALVYPRDFSTAPNPAQYRSEIAITKIDATTGAPISLFGVGGTALLPDHFYPAIDSAGYQIGSIPELLSSPGALFVSGKPQQSSNSLPFAKLDLFNGSLVAGFGVAGIVDLPMAMPSSTYCKSSPERVAVRLNGAGEISLVLRFNDSCSDLYAASIDTVSGALKTDLSADGYSVIDQSHSGSLFPFLVTTTPDGSLVMVPHNAHSGGYYGGSYFASVSVTQLAIDWRTQSASFGVFGGVDFQLARTTTFGNACGLQGHDGAMYFAGSLQLYGETEPRMRVARMTVDGLIDPSFGVNGLFELLPGSNTTYGSAAPCRITEDRIGNLYVFIGALPPGQADGAPTVVKLTTGGVLSTSFGQGGYAYQTIVPRPLNVKSMKYFDGNLYLVGENDGPVFMGLLGRLDVYLLKVNATTGQRPSQFGTNGYVLIRGSGAEFQTQYSVDKVWSVSPYGNALWVFGRFQAVVGSISSTSERFISRFDLTTGTALDSDHLRFSNASTTSDDALFAATVDGSGDRFVVNRTTLTRHAAGTGQPVGSFGSTGLISDIGACAVVAGRNHVYVLSQQALRAFDKSTGNVYTAFGLNG